MAVMRSITTRAGGGLGICGRTGFSVAFWEASIYGRHWRTWSEIQSEPPWSILPLSIRGPAPPLMLTVWTPPDYSTCNGGRSKGRRTGMRRWQWIVPKWYSSYGNAPTPADHSERKRSRPRSATRLVVLGCAGDRRRSQHPCLRSIRRINSGCFKDRGETENRADQAVPDLPVPDLPLIYQRPGHRRAQAGNRRLLRLHFRQRQARGQSRYFH